MLLIWYGAQVAGDATEATTAGDIRHGLVTVAFVPHGGRAVEPVTFAPQLAPFEPRTIKEFR